MIIAYPKNNNTALVWKGRGDLLRKIPGTTKTISGRRNRSEAGATELDLVSFITNGKVVIGKAMMRRTQRIQVMRDQIFEVTTVFQIVLTAESRQ